MAHGRTSTKKSFFLTADELLEGYHINTPDKDEYRVHTNKEADQTIYVRLNGRKAASGNVVLYLSFHHNGKTQRLYDGLTLYPETSPATRTENETTMRNARLLEEQENIKASKNPTSFRFRSAGENMYLYDFVLLLSADEEKKGKESKSLAYHYKALAKFIAEFERQREQASTLGEIDKDYIYEFVKWLKTAKRNYNITDGRGVTTDLDKVISDNTQRSTYARLRATMLQATERGCIKSNPFRDFDDDTKASREKPKGKEGNREYLTKEELQALTNTPCKHDNIKRAFIFGCYSGLRFSDLRRIRWADLTETQGRYILSFEAKKTAKRQIIPLSAHAAKCFPEGEHKPNDCIFELPENDMANYQLAKWVKEAGIAKHITFHSSRHTAATLALSNGAPIAVVSRLLGHSNITTTQIYAKIVDDELMKLAQAQDNLF